MSFDVIRLLYDRPGVTMVMITQESRPGRVQQIVPSKFSMRTIRCVRSQLHRSIQQASPECGRRPNSLGFFGLPRQNDASQAYVLDPS